MKKAIALVLAGMTAFSLAACGSGSGSTAASGAATTTAAAASTEAAPAASTEAAAVSTEAGSAAVDLSGSKYLSDGVLTVALNSTFPPFEYVGDGTDDFKAITANPTNATGFDVAMVNEIGTRLGVKVEIADMDFDGIIPALGTKADVAATGMTITDERKEAVNFSDPYYDATQSVLVKSDSTVATLDDLKKCTSVGCQLGTTGETVANDNGLKVNSVKSFNQAVLDLENGKNDAVVIDQIPGEAFSKQYSDLKLIDGSEFNFDVEQYGIAMPKDDEVMLNAINSTLADMKSDGTYDKLLEQYINNYEAE
jgi:ABC-type amino acid transport substrate-binding protein